jgi:hypothetical protein
MTEGDSASYISHGLQNLSINEGLPSRGGHVRDAKTHPPGEQMETPFWISLQRQQVISYFLLGASVPTTADGIKDVPQHALGLAL